MSAELPKDAEGREIPLDTECLYTHGGEKQDVLSFTYYRKKDRWEIETDTRFINSTCLYLTPLDSWEKLEEDLGKIVNHHTEVVCPYYDREIKDCEGCKLEGYDCSCSHAFLKDVMARIRKLRGED